MTLAVLGSIPACAGEPGTVAPCTRKPWVYPRVCGGDHHFTSGRRHGSIPACAGEPDKAGYELMETPVYPRVCGGTVISAMHITPLIGLSPRVRGNRRPQLCRLRRRRSIPACAGEPTPSCSRTSIYWVYPRVCGGTYQEARRVLLITGLSPRVRGNHPSEHYEVLCHRSIPACAGEPYHSRATVA